MLKEIDFQIDDKSLNNSLNSNNNPNPNPTPIRKTLLHSKTTILHNPTLGEVHPEKTQKKMPLRKMKTTVSSSSKLSTQKKENTNNPFKDPDLSMVSNDSFTKLKDGTVKRVRNKKNYKDLWLEKYNFIGVDMPEGGILHIEEEKKKEEKKGRKLKRYKTINYSNIENEKKKKKNDNNKVKFDTSTINSNNNNNVNKTTIEAKKKRSNLKNKNDENIFQKEFSDSNSEDENLLKMMNKNILVDSSTNPENINNFLSIEKNSFLYNKSKEKEKEIEKMNKKKKEIELMEEQNKKQKEFLENMEKEKNKEIEKFNNEK